MNPKKLIIIDLSNFIFRAYFAIRPLHSPKGIPVNAVYGVLNMLLKMMEKENPTHLLIAQDTKGGSFRNELYADYKANRSEPPEDLSPQFPIINEVLDALKLPKISMEGFVADDIIGSLVTQYQKDFDQILIASGDKDLMQFVNDNVFILDTMKDKLYRRDDVFEKMKVYPKSEGVV